MVPNVCVNLLGTVSVAYSGRDVDMGPPRQKALFAVLAARAGRAVSREDIVDAVWGAHPPRTVASSISTYVARLRRELEPERPLRSRSELLVGDTSGYRLQINPDRVDALLFESRLRTARHLCDSSRLLDAVRELEAALALWTGTAFGGVPGPFAFAERSRLDELRLGALEQHAELLLQLGRHEQVAAELSGLVHRYPLRERLRYLLMVSYARIGRRADALAEFRDLRSVLIAELGIEPAGDLQQLHEHILRGDHMPPPTPAATAGNEPSLVVPAQLSRDVPGFVGRVQELAELHALVDAAERVGQTAVVVINGSPGVGKSALATRFAHESAAQFPDGQIVLDLTGFRDPAWPMSSFDALYHLISALRPGIDVPPHQQGRIGLYRSLVAGRRLLIVLDDACNAPQVRPLLPGTPGCLVLVTSRSVLDGLTARDGARRLTLDLLSEDDAVALLREVAGNRFTVPECPLVRKLANACGRLPLALRLAADRIAGGAGLDITVKEFLEGDQILDSLEAQGDPSSSVRTVFNWSYRALPEEPAALFRALGRASSPVLTAGEIADLTRRSPCELYQHLRALIAVHLLECRRQGGFELQPLLFAYAQDLAAQEATG